MVIEGLPNFSIRLFGVISSLSLFQSSNIPNFQFIRWKNYDKIIAWFESLRNHKKCSWSTTSTLFSEFIVWLWRPAGCRRQQIIGWRCVKLLIWYTSTIIWYICCPWRIIEGIFWAGLFLLLNKRIWMTSSFFLYTPEIIWKLLQYCKVACYVFKSHLLNTKLFPIMKKIRLHLYNKLKRNDVIS